MGRNNLQNLMTIWIQKTEIKDISSLNYYSNDKLIEIEGQEEMLILGTM